MLSGGVAPGLRCVRMVKMQGTEDEGAGSVLKYMTKPESDSNAADWPLWHADLLTVQPSRLDSLACLFLSLRHEVQRSHTCWRCPRLKVCQNDQDARR